MSTSAGVPIVTAIADTTAHSISDWDPDVMTSSQEAPVATQYGDDGLMWFCVRYQAVHGYVCVLVCAFGIVANCMNITVLTRRNMVRVCVTCR